MGLNKSTTKKNGDFPTSIPYDPDELDDILTKCYELCRSKNKVELYIHEIETLFPNKPIREILIYMCDKNAVKLPDKLFNVPGDYNFFDTSDFLKKGGFKKQYLDEQANLKQEKKSQEIELERQKEIDDIDSKIRRAGLVSNRISVISTIFACLTLILTIAQSIQNNGFEERLKKLEDRKPIVDTIKETFYFKGFDKIKVQETTANSN